MDSARWFAVLAHDLAEQADRDATASRVLELITGAIGCSFAVLAHLTSRGALVYSNSTDQELLGKLAVISTSTEEGLAWEALRTRARVRVDDLDTESRWPRFTARLRAETRLRSALGYCLTLDNLVRGAMLLFSDEPGFFTDEICRFADVCVDHVAIALANSSYTRTGRPKRARTPGEYNARSRSPAGTTPAAVSNSSFSSSTSAW